ncbi:uncharacterized protein K452DRAFT_84653 [Aplosporella prunicola CBS 121167]|uniref:Uncharacterized protein n=1 Tax=Aplosporella prunicola CBS 121167 TaxID=1176127 RepID=A0A6A6B4M1_9PEZI|nr:uncharacterized protein K452DRAFT_84653 [Aplosporella prunicola CBS 121167]KAF2138796.1 hypothetical protein K452DRAFT_84653 [Aplosporella prunicola CBS 121167]
MDVKVLKHTKTLYIVAGSLLLCTSITISLPGESRFTVTDVTRRCFVSKQTAPTEPSAPMQLPSPETAVLSKSQLTASPATPLSA